MNESGQIWGDFWPGQSLKKYILYFIKKILKIYYTGNARYSSFPFFLFSDGQRKQITECQIEGDSAKIHMKYRER